MSSQDSLADKLASLLTPTPTIPDVDDDGDDVTRAKLATRTGSDDDDIGVAKSDLRRRLDPLLDDGDEKYAGRKISRKMAEEDDEDEEDDDEESDEEEEEEEEMDPEFKKILMAGDGEEEMEEEEELEEDEEEDEMEVDEEDDEDVDEDDEEEDDEKSKDSKDSRRVAQMEKKRIKEFEKRLESRLKRQKREDDVRADLLRKARAEKAKGVAVKAQLKTWDSLLELRIRLQKGLGLANRLPGPRRNREEEEGERDESWEDMTGALGVEEMNSVEECGRKVQKLSEALYKLQSVALKQVEGLQHVVKATKSPDDLQAAAEKRHRLFQPFRDETLSKWQEKTALTTAKSFHAFDTPIAEQIRLVLADRERLLTRTRTNRQGIEVLGRKRRRKKEEEEEEGEEKRKSRLHGFDVVEEIFDDSDFYQHLLRELIERKSSQTSDSSALGRQMVQLHKLRAKNKRKIDTRASKGRKVRYDPHQKLIGFAASTTSASLMLDSARDELFKSLFGARGEKKDRAEKKKTQEE